MADNGTEWVLYKSGDLNGEKVISKILLVSMNQWHVYYGVLFNKLFAVGSTPMR